MDTERQRTRRYTSWRQREQERLRHIMMFGGAVLGIVLVAVIFIKVFGPSADVVSVEDMEYDIGSPVKQTPRPELDVQLLTPNEYSRPGTPTEKIDGIVVHYTANPGSTAQNNRDYFENLKDTHDTKVSSNFVVGIEGEIVQCVPTAEMAYASNERNIDTVSIECCHPDETGEFTDATYDSLVELTAFLCGKFNLTTDKIIRHYDVTGKNCPKYFVENEAEWEAFKTDVAKYIAENGE